uniref:Uncharacterized protein n=1 Tax=Rhizophora mucronata TaxID=61149 RepID=A0A2P2PD15_RHIMU
MKNCTHCITCVQASEKPERNTTRKQEKAGFISSLENKIRAQIATHTHKLSFAYAKIQP